MSQPKPKYIQIVKDTAHVVAPKALEITSLFYKNMTTQNPEVWKYFNKTNQRSGRQPTALADAVIAYALNVDNLGALGGAVELMACKHCALGVQPDDYLIVHKHLMNAVGEILKVDATIAGGWSEAVLALAKILIDAEKAMYDAAEKRRGGWRGQKTFVVDEVVNEATNTVSIYFKSKDGSQIPEYTAGQFISVVENPSTDVIMAPRHYTISCPPNRANGRLRITVKKVLRPRADLDDGLMSSYVHRMQAGDEVHLHPPFGNAAVPFVAGEGSDPGRAAVVYLTAGIGVTTSLPLASVEIESRRRQAIFIHADHDPSSHALAREQASTGCPCLFAYSGSSSAGAARGDQVTVEAGARLTAARALEFASRAAGGTGRVRWWVCGPPGFMAAMAHGLVRAGVDKSRLHYEAFGPAQDICPAAGA